MAILNSITQAVGNTPIVKLNRIAGEGATVGLKLEFYNPANSVKDRIGVSIIDAAEASGQLKPGGTIVEGTSGNTGIALAWVAAARGYKLVLTMPDSMSVERRALLRAFGAELVLTPKADGMRGAVEAANKIAAERGGVLASQFANPANPGIHYATTGPEIWEATEGKIDIFVSAFGTAGTVSGAGKYLKEQNPNIQVVAVEPTESPLLSQGNAGPHGIQGIGANFVPEVLDRGVIDEILTVATPDALATARALATEEGILTGISAGAAAKAAIELAARPENAGKLIVAIAPDFGERYLSTPLFAGLRDE
ncbi:MAG: cysteine synthase A [Propionibacteriaceae bacterium]|jgi:cysteine synthase A|nr:cysteine synthase A [Propionibacteriaceae bacterium]